MENLFAERLKSARLMKGFSLQDLADAIDNQFSRQTLHRYEKGEVMPDSEKTLLLSQALDVTVDYFFRNTKVELGEIEYRKQEKLPRKEAVAIQEKTKDYLERYLELEEILRLPTAFEDPLKDFSVISSFDDVNKAAEIVRKAWSLGLGPIFNIVELLEDNHIKVVKLDVDEDFDGLQALVTREDKAIPVIAYNVKKANKPDRIRFTLLHELAHLLFKFEEGVSEKQKETYCNQFAGAMLFPKETLFAELGEKRNKLSVLELGNIKKQYGISMQAIVLRARDSGIISEYYTDQLFFVFRQMNWRIDEPYDYSGVEESNRFEQLLFRALIEEQISISKAASLSNQTLAEFRNKHRMVI